MSLEQLHALKVWHERHAHRSPVEAEVWNALLTLWVMGWVGAPIAWVLGRKLLIFVGLAATLLPGRYVALRSAMHRSGRLRCDWVAVLHRSPPGHR
jgi:hypothetical protein